MSAPDAIGAAHELVPTCVQSEAGALLMYGLLHQWSSSRAALVAALTRRRARGLSLMAALESGRSPTRAELASWIHDGDAIQLAFPEIVAAEPKNAAALTNLGLALCQAQRAKDAVPFLQRAVSLAPGNITARQDLAAAYVSLGQFDDAIAALRAALKLSPNDARLHYDLGVAFKMQDDAAAAIPASVEI